MPEPAAADVIVERSGRVGRLILNRPQALNALTTPMVETMTEALEKWVPEGLRAVTIESASDRVFCAGGDIRQIRQNTLDGRYEDSERFFSTEYALNATLASYPVPVVALIGGLCMGRARTERSRTVSGRIVPRILCHARDENRILP